MREPFTGQTRERDFIAEYFIVRVYRQPPPGGPPTAYTGLVEDKRGDRWGFQNAGEIGEILVELLDKEYGPG
jgi:hypothetical protein